MAGQPFIVLLWLWAFLSVFRKFGNWLGVFGVNFICRRKTRQKERGVL
jgi:hypothetical protein